MILIIYVVSLYVDRTKIERKKERKKKKKKKTNGLVYRVAAQLKITVVFR